MPLSAEFEMPILPLSAEFGMPILPLSAEFEMQKAPARGNERALFEVYGMWGLANHLVAIDNVKAVAGVGDADAAEVIDYFRIFLGSFD